jgi:hypothetical protein
VTPKTPLLALNQVIRLKTFMTTPKHNTSDGKRYFSCCQTPDLAPWKSLRVFMQENFLTREQVYTRAKKGKIALIIYRGKYKARLVKPLDEDC